MITVERDERPEHILIFDDRSGRSVVVHESWLPDLIDQLRTEIGDDRG